MSDEERVRNFPRKLSRKAKAMGAWIDAPIWSRGALIQNMSRSLRTGIRDDTVPFANGLQLKVTYATLCLHTTAVPSARILFPTNTLPEERPFFRPRPRETRAREHKETIVAYNPSDARYQTMRYNRSGRSGLKLPAISLGLWHNFGGASSLESGRKMIRAAFDLGITHFDLANNYGPPPGSAEESFGRILATDLAGHRDELVVSTKAGYLMWPGPYGEWGSRKYVLASLDQSLRRMGIDYVDIFYSHRFDPETPLEETMSALDRAVRSGKALYVGISSYSAAKTREATRILASLGTPCVIHQPSYSMLNRWIESELLDVLGKEGIGCIVFSPLAQGMLSDKYLNGVPPGSRAGTPGTALSASLLTKENLDRVRALNELARARGQSLAQMALAWCLRDGRVTSALIGASSPAQIAENVAALGGPSFTAEELSRIDTLAVESGINLWARSSGAG